MKSINLEVPSKSKNKKGDVYYVPKNFRIKLETLCESKNIEDIFYSMSIDLSNILFSKDFYITKENDYDNHYAIHIKGRKLKFLPLTTLIKLTEKIKCSKNMFSIHLNHTLIEDLNEFFLDLIYATFVRSNYFLRKENKEGIQSFSSYSLGKLYKGDPHLLITNCYTNSIFNLNFSNNKISTISERLLNCKHQKFLFDRGAIHKTIFLNFSHNNIKSLKPIISDSSLPENTTTNIHVDNNPLDILYNKIPISFTLDDNYKHFFNQKEYFLKNGSSGEIEEYYDKSFIEKPDNDSRLKNIKYVANYNDELNSVEGLVSIHF